MGMKTIIAMCAFPAFVRCFYGTESAQVLPPVVVDVETLVCNGGICLQCTEEVLSADHRKMETPKNCELVKKESQREDCGRNGKNCTAFRISRSNNHIRHNSHHNKANRDHCCNLLRHNQNERVCGEGGTYECHGNDRPQCNCPVGRKGLHCEHISSEHVYCFCVADKYSLQDTYVGCNSMEKPPNWTKCFLHEHGLNCLCRKSINGSTAEMPSCSSLPIASESQILSSSRKLSPCYVLIAIVLPIVLLVVK